MPEEIEIADKVGSVSQSRYAQIVAELRKPVETASRIQFTIGDYALKVEPMRESGGQERNDELFTVKDPLFRLAEDIEVSYPVVKNARWTASRWPKDRRVSRVSFTVHKILAGIGEEEERFTARWAAAGVVGQIRDQLRKRIRHEMSQAPGAVATVIDSQSLKAAETVGKDSRGYDRAKKTNGRKRHLIVDTKGPPLFIMVTPADMTDRDAAKEVLFRLGLMHPEITITRADSSYAGQLVTRTKTSGSPSRPSADQRTPPASSSCPDAGSSSGRSPGSCTPAATHTTTNGSSNTPSR
ncbi:DUF6192 family protein [Streptomyces inhibens]|nr:DUF6192 family protein [Streptomyces inhibens]UKY47417.1 DUF6192 family protein [Streptomyces inhibens]